MKNLLPILLLVMITSIFGCGSSAGTWEDDAQNWNRAFNSTQPKDVNIIHSKFWISSHWTYEYSYFFKIEKNDLLKKQLFAKNKLKQIEGKEAEEAMNDFFDEKPIWFIPLDATKYDIYILIEPKGNFKVFVDKETNDIYLTDYSV
jgi:hypothetical protein